MLEQIKREQKNSVSSSSAHMFEVDNFQWRFDILSLRANLRTYCIKEGLWVPPSQVISVRASADEPFKGISLKN